jgi:uncharacterized protein YdhG (YjbR/CyaY superfamily)
MDEYIAGFPRDVQEILKKIRVTIKETALDPEETIKYQMPTFILRDNLVRFCCWQKHIGFYHPSTAYEILKDELSGYPGQMAR